MATIDELVIKIKSDVKDAVTNIDRVKRSVDSLSDRVRLMGERFKAAGSAMTSAGTQMSAAILPAAAALGFAVKTGASFEQQMRNVQSVLGGTEEDFRLLTKFARHIGETTIFSASQAAEGMYKLASAGYSVAEIMASMKDIVDFAAATQSDFNSASELVVSTLNAYQMSASDASRVTNVFAAAIANSQLTMERIAFAMPYIAGISHQLGLSLEETTATLGILVSNGVKAEMAGRLLASSMGRLLDPTREMKEVLAEYGITQEEISPQIHTLTEIVERLSQANMDATAITRLFGAESTRVWTTLISAGAPALSDLTTKITGTNKASEMMDIQLNSVSNAIRLFKSKIEEIEISVFDQLKDTIDELIEAFEDALPTIKEFIASFVEGIIPAIRDFLGVAKKIIDWYNDLSPVLKKVIAYFAGFGLVVTAVIAPILIFGGVVASAIGSLLTLKATIMSTGIAMKLFGFISKVVAGEVLTASTIIKIAIGPIGWVILAISSLGMAWKVNLFGIRDKTKKVFDWLYNKFGWFAKIVDWLKRKISWFTDTTEKEIGEDMTSAWEEEIKKLLESMEALKDWNAEMDEGIDKVRELKEELKASEYTPEMGLKRFGFAFETLEDVKRWLEGGGGRVEATKAGITKIEPRVTPRAVEVERKEERRLPIVEETFKVNLERDLARSREQIQKTNEAVLKFQEANDELAERIEEVASQPKTINIHIEKIITEEDYATTSKKVAEATARGAGIGNWTTR